MTDMEKIDRALKKQREYVDKVAECFASTDYRLFDKRAALRSELQAAEEVLEALRRVKAGSTPVGGGRSTGYFYRAGLTPWSSN
jgi:hypothetical protein